MSDSLDRAQALNELSLAVALSHRKPEPAVKTSAYCLNCQEPTQNGARWCDEDCRADWQKRENRR